MPRVSPYRIELTCAEREELEARARRYTSPYRDVVRAKLVLLGLAVPGGLGPPVQPGPHLAGRIRPPDGCHRLVSGEPRGCGESPVPGRDKPCDSCILLPAGGRRDRVGSRASVLGCS